MRDADQIPVLDEGEIVARDTHEVLLSTSEPYNEILGSRLETERAGEGIQQRQPGKERSAKRTRKEQSHDRPGYPT